MTSSGQSGTVDKLKASLICIPLSPQSVHPVNGVVSPFPRLQASLTLHRQGCHLPERRLLSFILLLPCLGLSKLPLDSSELPTSWDSSDSGI